MPVFEYIALDVRGRRRKGIIEAGGVAAARQKLREGDVYPVDLKEAHAVHRAEPGDLFSSISIREISVVTRQLSTLLGAGLPLIPSLNALIAQTRHPRMKKILAQIKSSVNEGNSLTKSMAGFPHLFSPFYVNMVSAGEASGTLNSILERLADFYEGQQALKMKIRSALAYPVLMSLIGGAVLIFLLSFVVPNITKIFQDMHQKLPAITVLLIAVSAFLKDYGWLLIVMIGAVLTGGRYAVKKTVWGRYGWDRLKLTAPLLGALNRKIIVARFCRTLGTLLKSDVPLLVSLGIVRNVLNNRLMADEIQKTADEVEEGQSICVPLERNGLFPPMAIEMIAVGEQSGNLETMLSRIADALEKEAEADILLLTSLLEPIMILIMGLLVGFIVISILLPIFEMNQLIR